jgi:hypothetical protein
MQRQIDLVRWAPRSPQQRHDPIHAGASRSTMNRCWPCWSRVLQAPALRRPVVARRRSFQATRAEPAAQEARTDRATWAVLMRARARLTTYTAPHARVLVAVVEMASSSCVLRFLIWKILHSPAITFRLGKKSSKHIQVVAVLAFRIFTTAGARPSPARRPPELLSAQVQVR